MASITVTDTDSAVSASRLSPLMRQLRPLLLDAPAEGFTGARLAQVITATTRLEKADVAHVAASLVRNEAVHVSNVDVPLPYEADRFTEKYSTTYVMYAAVRMGSRMPAAVLTEFAPCYSPSCHRQGGCYVPTCPYKVSAILNRTNSA